MMAAEVLSFIDLIDVENRIKNHEKATATKFVLDYGKSTLERTAVNSSDTLWWSLPTKGKETGLSIPLSPVPFVLLGKAIYICQHGRDKGKTRKRKYKEELDRKMAASDHCFHKRRFSVQDTKKVGCPAMIEIKKIAKLPDFGLTSDTKKTRAATRKSFLKACVERHNIVTEIEYVVRIPTLCEHQGHLTGEMAGFIEPVDLEVKKKVRHLVQNGMRDIRQILACIDEFVRNDLCHGVDVPARTRRRFHPHPKDISNIIQSVNCGTRNSRIDQEHVADLAATAGAFFRPATEEPEEPEMASDITEETVAEETTAIAGEIAAAELRTLEGSLQDEQSRKMLFVYQSADMKHLYNRYGRNLVLLDSTHRVCRYALPLFFLVVRTNVDYQVAAVFTPQDEQTESIVEALLIIKRWNPDVTPKFAMVDFSHEEINALSRVYPDIQVFLCDFHREQAWLRWLSKTDNSRGIDKDAVLAKLRRIANAQTEEDMRAGIAALPTQQEQPKLRKWLNTHWIPYVKLWSNAHIPDEFLFVVKTNNGTERLNEELKYGFLYRSKRCSLTQILKIIINEFLPERYTKSYTWLNVKSHCGSRRYNPNLPQYMHNLPRQVVVDLQRKRERLDPGMVESVTQQGTNMFTVRSSLEDRDYQVYFGSDRNYCTCTCESWRRHRVLCKHFLAVLESGKGAYNDITPLYTNNPMMRLDETLFQAQDNPNQQALIVLQAASNGDNAIVDQVDLEEGEEEPPQDLQVQPEAATPLTQQAVVQDLPQPTGASSRLKDLRSKLRHVLDLSFQIKEPSAEFLDEMECLIDDQLDLVKASVRMAPGGLVLDSQEPETRQRSSRSVKRLQRPKKRHQATGRVGRRAELLRATVEVPQVEPEVEPEVE